MAGTSEWQRSNPETIRDMLTEREITASDPRVKFVTLEAYEKAGAQHGADLFTEDDSGIFIEDVGLLDGLFVQKLEKAAMAVREEGWKWSSSVPPLITTNGTLRTALPGTGPTDRSGRCRTASP